MNAIRAGQNDDLDAIAAKVHSSLEVVSTATITAADIAKGHRRDARDWQKQTYLLLDVLEHFGIGVCQTCNGEGWVDVEIPGSGQWNDGCWGPETADIRCDADGCFMGFARMSKETRQPLCRHKQKLIAYLSGREPATRAEMSKATGIPIGSLSALLADIEFEQVQRGLWRLKP